MENNFWSHINKVLQVGVIVVDLFITNLVLVILSIISFLFLTPACITSTLNMSRSISNKDYDNLLIKYFSFIKKNAFKSFKVALPFMLIHVIVLSNIFYLSTNKLPFTNSFISGVILLLQLLVIFEAFNIMILALIQLTINHSKPSKLIYRDAFLIGNRYFFRMISSSIVIFIVFYLGYEISLIFFLISTTLAIFLYYISFSLIIDRHFDEESKLISKQ